MKLRHPASGKEQGVVGKCCPGKDTTCRTPLTDTGQAAHDQVPLAHDHGAVAAQLGQEDEAAWRALIDSGKHGRTWVTISVSEAVGATGLRYPALRRALRRDYARTGRAIVQVAPRSERSGAHPNGLPGVSDGVLH